MIRLLNSALGGLVGAVLWPFRLESPWPGMIAVSLFATLLVLVIFKFASSQRLIRKRRDRLLARVLELILFKDDIVVNLGAFVRVLWANALYLLALLPPVLVTIVPLILILLHLHTWFGIRPLRTGEETVVTARLRDDTPVMQQEISLQAQAGVVVETGPVRVPSRNEVSWRVRPAQPGQHRLAIGVGGIESTKTLVAGARLARASARRVDGGLWRQLTDPVERPLDSDGPVKEIRLAYPSRDLLLGPFALNWLVVFFVLTILFGLALKGPLRVEV